MLRCRKGDRAMITTGPYMGYIVRVGEFVGDKEIRAVGGGNVKNNDWWRIHDAVIELDNPGQCLMAPDAFLEPIRNTKTQKETRA